MRRQEEDRVLAVGSERGMNTHARLRSCLILLSLSLFQQHSTARGAAASTPEHEAPDPDFIYATSSFTARHALVDASRAWRAGIRTFVMTNDSKYVEQERSASEAYHEHYAHFVDDSEEDGTMRGRMSGEWNATHAGHESNVSECNDYTVITDSGCSHA